MHECANPIMYRSEAHEYPTQLSGTCISSGTDSVRFFHDAADNGANAHWLKTALGLGQTTEDSIVLEHLRNAVSNVFTVLQSLVTNRADEGILRMSSEFVACIAKNQWVTGNRFVCKNVPHDVWHPRGT